MCPFTRRIELRDAKHTHEVYCNGQRIVVHDTIDAPCGKCLICLYKRSQAWIMRLKATADVQKSQSYFITLTYNDDNCPTYISTDTGLVSNVLDKSDLRNFIKRLRRNLQLFYGKEACKGIKYFAIGEYGSNTYRPHYHLLIFGLPVVDDLTQCYRNLKRYNTQFPKMEEFVKRCWNPRNAGELGHVKVDSVSKGRICYVTKYLTFAECLPPDFLYTDLQGEKLLLAEYKPFKNFMLCSHGIGIEFLSEQVKEWIYRNKITYYNDLDERTGKVYKKELPKYFLRKIYTEDELFAISQDKICKRKELEVKLAHSVNKWWKSKGKVGEYKYSDYFDYSGNPLLFITLDQTNEFVKHEFLMNKYRHFCEAKKSKKVKNYVEI